MTGIVTRVVRQLSAAAGASARVALKLTTSGIELDVGASRRLGEVATGGCSVTVGLQVCAWGPADGRQAGMGDGRGCSSPPCRLSRSMAHEQAITLSHPVPPATHSNLWQGIALMPRCNPVLLSTIRALHPSPPTQTARRASR